MTHTEYTTMNLGEIVVEDFRTAAIFKEAGIDFCCGGKKSLNQACNEKNIETSKIVAQLKQLESTQADQSHNFKEWSLDFLCDYIVNTHHKYVLKTLPELFFYTKKIASVHGEHHPELLEIADLFGKINSELLQHLKMEEEILFPAIKNQMKINILEIQELINSEITRMSSEHEFAGGAMDTINVLSNGYKVPEDGCNTYHVTYKLLQQFEDDLHIHVHLENNILYPKALLIR